MVKQPYPFLFCVLWYARQDLNPPEADFADAQPAAYGFEVQESLI